MTEYVAPFCIVDGSFKPYLEQSRPIMDFIPWKQINSTGYNAAQSEKWLNLSETTFWLAQENSDEVVFQKCTDYIL